MKKHNNFLFVELDTNGIFSDCSDGYLKSFENDNRVKLPHNNYTVLGIVQETIDSPYAEDFSKEIVDYITPIQGYGGYCNYLVDAWCYHLDTAVESMKTLIEKLDLKPTDYILRDENR